MDFIQRLFGSFISFIYEVKQEVKYVKSLRFRITLQLKAVREEMN